MITTPWTPERRGRGYRNLTHLLLKAQRLAFTGTKFTLFDRPRKMPRIVGFLRRAKFSLRMSAAP